MIQGIARLQTFSFHGLTSRYLLHLGTRNNFLQCNVRVQFKWSKSLPTINNGVWNFTAAHLHQRLTNDLKLHHFQRCKLPSVRNYVQKSKNDDDSTDDLQAILKNRSLGITAKFKLLFKQYGVVMAGVHIVTSAVWVALIYFSLQR